MKHLLKVLSIRAIIMGGIATGLCFLFPAFIVPIAIAAGASYLISAAATITYAKKIDKEIDNIFHVEIWNIISLKNLEHF